MHDDDLFADPDGVADEDAAPPPAPPTDSLAIAFENALHGGGGQATVEEQNKNVDQRFDDALAAFQAAVRALKKKKNGGQDSRHRPSMLQSLMGSKSPSAAEEVKVEDIDEQAALNELISAAVHLTEETADATAMTFGGTDHYQLLRGTEEILIGQIEFAQREREDEVASALQEDLQMWRQVKNGGDFHGEHFNPAPLQSYHHSDAEQQQQQQQQASSSHLTPFSMKPPEPMKMTSDQDEHGRMLQDRRRRVAAAVKAQGGALCPPHRLSAAQRRVRVSMNSGSSSGKGAPHHNRHHRNSNSNSSQKHPKRGVSASSLKAKEVWERVHSKPSVEDPRSKEERDEAMRRHINRLRVTQKVKNSSKFKKLVNA